MMCPTIETPQGLNGLRRMTPDMRRSNRIADGFAGLPEGISRWRLAAATRGAARKLGLNASMLALIEHYIDVTYDVDWSDGSEPIVTRPLVEIAEHMGKSERQIRNLERMLAARGLLVWRDSGNHHRKGRRDRDTGRLRYAYGPSLAPLAARATEIIALATDARRELVEIRQLRIAISALRRRVRAEIADFTGDNAELSLALQAFQSLPIRNPVKTSVTALQNQIEQLKAIIFNLQLSEPHTHNDAIREPHISGLEEKNRRHNTVTTKERSINGSCSASIHKSQIKSRDIKFDNQHSLQTQEKIAIQAGLDKITIDMAASSLGPKMKFFTETNFGTFGWSNLIASAVAILPDIGLNQTIWGQACAILGRNGAALAILIVERGIDRQSGDRYPPIANPPAYLQAMLDRARSGKLDLQKSIFALMRGQKS